MASSWRRTHTCGDLTVENVDQTVTLNGWVANSRHHGGVLFLDLRDRYGLTQVTVDSERAGVAEGTFETAKKLGAEDVIAVHGVVSQRVGDQVNKERKTGEIEVFATSIEILNESATPPFEIVDPAESNEELRMRYRFLDLRRPSMTRGLELRAKFVTAIRNSLAKRDFVDVETPILTKSTPEGARDYLVPSRVNPGKFYALPQSPQIFKQLMMVAGLDRYYQIARCFRDEDLRADRQPEFTQIDLEMSFVEQDDVLEVVEAAMRESFAEAFGVELTEAFPRLTYEEAMRRFGSDKPDLRFGMELIDVGPVVANSSFKVFTGALEKGGAVNGLCVEGVADKYSRKDIEKGLAAHAAEYGAKGLAWLKVSSEGLVGPVAKFFEGDAQTALLSAMGAKDGDLLLFVADKTSVVRRALGELRNKLGTDLGFRKPGTFQFGWITDFPLFLHDEDNDRWDSAAHPFTAPVDWDIEDLAHETASIKSRAYDLVLNGWELGSGSIRIHREDVQQKVFSFLGISDAEQRDRFGFLLDALKYGAPPHGGIALGVDRIVALAMGFDSLRDAIAFPKTTSATDLMSSAPSEVAPEQLDELYVRSTAPAPDAEKAE